MSMSVWWIIKGLKRFVFLFEIWFCTYTSEEVLLTKYGLICLKKLLKIRHEGWASFNNHECKADYVFLVYSSYRQSSKIPIHKVSFSFQFQQVSIPTYTDTEYLQELQSPTWTRAETDHLFDLCHRFDLRFIVIHDRYDTNKFPTGRTIEDLKQRYYFVCHTLAKVGWEKNC